LQQKADATVRAQRPSNAYTKGITKSRQKFASKDLALDTLLAMRLFARVVEEGSFTVAAQRMDTTTASVSRAVGYLESHLRTRLLNRTTRSLSLTEAGRRYLQHCQQILPYIDQAEAEATDVKASPSGHLRVHATPSFGQAYVVPAVMRYQQHHRSVSVDLTMSDHASNIVEEGYDAAICLSAGRLPDSGLTARRLGTLHSVLCASPAYLRKHETPHRVAGLARHACLQLVSALFPRDRWDLDGPLGRETFELPPSTFQVNLPDALSTALRTATGIGALPMQSAAPALNNGSLIRVLPDYQLQTLTAYVVYPSRQYLSSKLGTFVNFLLEVIPRLLSADHAALK
jgi:DNA-binding transcriptional LysR family regulator